MRKHKIVVSTFDDAGLLTEVEVEFTQVKTGEKVLLKPHVRIQNAPKGTDVSFNLKDDEWTNAKSFFEQLSRFTDPGELVDTCKKILGGLFMSNPGMVLAGLVKREKKE